MTHIPYIGGMSHEGCEERRRSLSRCPVDLVVQVRYSRVVEAPANAEKIAD